VPSNNVRVSNNGDSHAAGQARYGLKIAAIGYDSARHGIDADVKKARTGRAHLHSAAFEYYEAITGTRLQKRSIDLYQFDDDLTHAASAYVNARHGIDADTGLCRAGLALLCSASIEFCEAVAGADPRNRPVDPHLQLNNGA